MSSSFLPLKIIVILMTLSLFIGTGFIIYGLVWHKPIPSSSLSFSLPKNACLHHIKYHGDTVTLVYALNHQLFFTSFSKNNPFSTRIINLHQPYSQKICPHPQE